jgi:hypothetical protein
MKDKILELLMMQGFTKRKQLLQELQLSGFKVSDRQMRFCIESMIANDGYCIQSCEKGYRLITQYTELEDAISYLKKKAYPLFERANNLHKNFNKDKFNSQLTFETFFR